MSSFIFAVGLIAAAQSGVGQQFDLACSGSRRELGTGTTAEWSNTYRVDLATGVYCLGDCTSTERIREVTPLSITLDDQTSRFGRSRTVLDRARGTITIDLTSSAVPGRFMAYRVEGTCVPRPFSGFPSVRF